MTEQELKDRGIDIESYAGGWIIADYSGKIPSRFGARYRGVSGAWRDQPIIADPFCSRGAAVKAAQMELDK